MTGTFAPEFVPCVDFVTLDCAVKVVGIVVAEHENWVTGLLELLNEFVLFWSVCEITDCPQKFIAGVCPVEDARKFCVEFLNDIDIARFLLRIIRIWCFYESRRTAYGGLIRLRSQR